MSQILFDSRCALPIRSLCRKVMDMDFEPVAWRTSLLLGLDQEDVDGDVKPSYEELQLTMMPRNTHSGQYSILPPSPAQILPLRDPTTVAISGSLFTNYTVNSPDVHRSPVVNAPALQQTSSATRHHGSPSSLPSSLSRPLSRSPSQHFENSVELAAHLGIPRILPPVPRTTAQRSPSMPEIDFQSLAANYLNMLATEPSEVSVAVAPASPVASPPPPPSVSTVPVVQDQMALVDDIMGDYSAIYMSNWRADESYFPAASPEFQSLGDDFDFLTSPQMTTYGDDFSPFDDSPYSTFLPTPHLGDDSNIHAFAGDFGFLPAYSDAPLFADVDMYEPHKEPTPVAVAAPPVPTLDATNLYTMTKSPATSSLDTFPPVTRRIPSSAITATGHRKNITPAALVPLDAPTQPRKYKTPSATSRKELPARFVAAKRKRAQAFDDDEEDELDESQAPAPNASEKEQIEWKRRQNTIAARKSRKRKLEYTQSLENENEELRRDRDHWKLKAETYLAIAQSQGIMGSFDDGN